MVLKRHLFMTLEFAIKEAFERAEAQGYIVIDKEQNWDLIHPETYQSKLYALEKNNKQSKKCLNITIYKLPSYNYELTTYIN